MIRFEHPLSERVRSFLSIEHLFNRFQAESMRQEDSPCPHHLALLRCLKLWNVPVGQS